MRQRSGSVRDHRARRAAMAAVQSPMPMIVVSSCRPGDAPTFRRSRPRAVYAVCGESADPHTSALRSGELGCADYRRLHFGFGYNFSREGCECIARSTGPRTPRTRGSAISARRRSIGRVRSARISTPPMRNSCEYLRGTGPSTRDLIGEWREIVRDANGDWPPDKNGLRHFHRTLLGDLRQRLKLTSA